MKVRHGLLAAGALAIGAAGIPVTGATAQDFDMDCKVILCLAGGFPDGCSDAYDYMMKRLSRFPPKPPFGICSQSDGSDYSDFTTKFSRFENDEPAGYDCPEGKKLQLRRRPEDEGGDVEAFCYTSTTRAFHQSADGGEWVVGYLDRSRATRVDFEIQVTVEPGTEEAYRSPVYRMNNSGYRREIGEAGPE